MRRVGLAANVPSRAVVLILMGIGFTLLDAASCLGEVTIAVGHDRERSEFSFDGVAPAAVNDIASTASVSVVEGVRDRNAARVECLIDGELPVDSDQPAENFFFGQGTNGGRIVLDFGKAVSLKEISTFSWHRSSRGPQVYTLFAAEGKSAAFNPAPTKSADPVSCGWNRVAAIDTRPDAKDIEAMGGQYGVTISADADELSAVRYLLFDVQQTEMADGFGNTFYCEIDAIEKGAPPPKAIERVKPTLTEFISDDGNYRFSIDSTQAPDLTQWAGKSLVPVVKEWYPRIVEELPSDAFQPPRQVVLKFRNDMGGVPAAASGSNVNLNSSWFRSEIHGEARGSVVHELVHVVQQYGRASRTARNSVPTPGWIVEGIADYIRWYGYEPQSKGTEIRKEDIDSIQYDSSYRVTANFLHWVTLNHDKDIVRTLNAAARDGRYDEGIWSQRTGKSVQELGVLWKRSLAQ